MTLKKYVYIETKIFDSDCIIRYKVQLYISGTWFDFFCYASSTFVAERVPNPKPGQKFST
tara:strand:- start:337 stop:516 length:180 start_codon:yes stop_codon:yes gene_type:complete